MEHSSGRSGTVDKALDLLLHLHAADRARGLTEIARSLELPKSTAHRLLQTLVRRGLVEQADRGRYRPGIALVALGLGVLDREPVVLAARPILEMQARALGHTLFLATARAGRILVLDKEEGRGFLRASPRIGAELPVHATAIGKLYLALAPDSLTLEPGGLEAFTPRTLAAGPALERELAEVRLRGWAENREEWIPGLAGLAAPVLHAGRVVAALAVSGPAPDFRGRVRLRLCDGVRAAAREVGARLNGPQLQEAS